MNKLTTKLLSLSAMLLLFMAFSASSALAQNFATPNGKADGDGEPADGFCSSVADPCNLATALQDATDGGANGSTVFVILPNEGATVTFQEELDDDPAGAACVGPAPDNCVAVDADVTFSTSLGIATGVEGIIAVEGDIVIESGVTLSIAADVELRLVGQPGRLILNDTAAIAGDGFIGFTPVGGDHLILLGEQFVDCSDTPTPNTGSIRNARVDKPNGKVNVLDECSFDDPSRLNITNRLDVEAGTLNMNDNNLFLTGLSDASGGDDAGVTISGGGVISGFGPGSSFGTVFIMVEEPGVTTALAKTAAEVGFANTPEDCFVIDGAGNMNMAFDKVTNAGVCIDLGEIGAGGFSFNRSGSLFVREAIQLNSSFLNESAAGPGSTMTSGVRTEFWKLKTITTNLEIVGPGEEVADPFGDFITAPTAGHCETGGQDVGNESGVYFFKGVTIGGDLVMTDTDDPDTDPCVEGLWFLGDPDPDDPVTALKAGGPATHQTFSTIEGDFSADDANGVFLDSPGGGFVHNVAFEGDFIFDAPSPTFTLVDPADAFGVADLCFPKEADGNKVLFTGGDDQRLRYTDTLIIESVQINKDDTNDEVEIDEHSGIFTIGTTLEIIRGEFITNGKLDAEGTVILQATDFSLDKSVDNATPDYQTNVVFTLTLTNLGPTPGTATVTDFLPSGLTFVSADPAADYNDATGTWTTDVVAVGDTRMLTITARVETLKPVTNEAEITCATPPDPQPINNSASAAITPVASDLALTKGLADFFGDSDTNIITATFKLTVTNLGPSDATGVTVDDPLPEGATLVSATAPYNPDTGIWTIGALTVGTSATLVTVLTADAEHNLINIAVVSGDQPDQDPSNNLSGSQAQHDLPDLLRFQADLELEKTVDNETPAAGGLITYTLEVTNRGSSATAGVVVRDTLAAGLAFVSAEVTSEAGQCSTCGYDEMQGLWTVGHLALNARATLEITVRVTGSGSITNTAEIIENHLPDRNGDNDIASATITVSSSTQAKATATEDEAGVPEAYALRQNYPNPFNPSTEIRFDLPEGAYVRLVVYDAMGREVTRLVDGSLGVGRHAVRWDATGLPSGAYLYRLTAGTFAEARVMVLLR